MGCGPLRALDLVVRGGERVGVIGPAGSGKRALAHVLAGLREPERGRVRRHGRDVTGQGQGHEPPAGQSGGGAPGVAWIAAGAPGFDRLDVGDNVLAAALGPRGRSHRVAAALAERALERCGLADQVRRPLRRLDRDGLTRLAAARALVAPRQLVVVDRLSGLVEPTTRAAVAAALNEAVALGAATVWFDVPESPPVAVDRLLVVAHGRVLAEGPPEKILASRLARDLLGGPDPQEPASRGRPMRHATAGPSPTVRQTRAAVADRDPARSSGVVVAGWRAGAGVTASPPVTFAVGPGESLAVVAPAGGGTSRLLRSLAGLEDGSGSLQVDGCELAGAAPARRARAGLAFAAQHGVIASGLTVTDHLSLRAGRRKGRWTPAILLRAFPALGLAATRPARELADTERRCLALASALAQNPTVLVVDRLLDGLTDAASEAIVSILDVARQEVALVLAELPGGPALAVADRVVELAALHRAEGTPPT